MKQWRRWAVVGAVACAGAALPVASLDSAGVSRADDGCGVGMYYNWDSDQCEPWAQAPGNVYINPVPVPVPNFNVCVGGTGRRGHVSVSGCV